MTHLEHHFIKTNDITLHVVAAGPESGPLVILLHGFPEFWYGWRAQIPALAGSGFRVLAPDQRGYNISDKPKGVAAYRLDLLAKDILGLMDANQRDRAYLVGHDWGAIVAWWIALTAPERLHRLAILNVPHPTVMRRRLRSDPQQMARSTYAAFFQLPRLPEAVSRANNWRLAAGAMQSSSLPGTFTAEDIDAYRMAWSQPGAYTAMLNWYRAAVRNPALERPGKQVTVPTTIIWGAKDRFLGAVMAEESAALCDQAELILLEGNTHWVQHEAAATVNEILIARFSS